MELNHHGKPPYRWAAPQSGRRHVTPKSSTVLTTSQTTATKTTTPTTAMNSTITRPANVASQDQGQQGIADLSQGLQKMHLNPQTPTSLASAPQSVTQALVASTCTTSSKSSISTSSSNCFPGKPLETPVVPVSGQESDHNSSFASASTVPSRLHESSSEMVSERNVSLPTEGHSHARSAPRPGKPAYDSQRSKSRNQSRKQSYSSRREGFSDPRQRVVHQDGLFPNPTACPLTYFPQAPPLSFEHFPPLSRHRPQEFMWDGAGDRMVRGQQTGTGDVHRRDCGEGFQGNGVQNKNGVFASGRRSFSEDSHRPDPIWRYGNGQRQRQPSNSNISFPDHSCGHDRNGTKKLPASYYSNTRDIHPRDNQKRRKSEYRNMNEQRSRYDRYSGFCVKANQGYQDPMREVPWYSGTIDVSRPPPTNPEHRQGMWAQMNGNDVRMDFHTQREQIYAPLMGNDMSACFKTPANYKRLVSKTYRARSVENTSRNMPAFHPQRQSETTNGAMPAHIEPPVFKDRRGRRNSSGTFGGRRSRSFDKSLDALHCSLDKAQSQQFSVWPSDHNDGSYHNTCPRERQAHMPTKAIRCYRMESSSSSSVSSISSHSGGEEMNGRHWDRQIRTSGHGKDKPTRRLPSSSSENFSEEIKEEMARARKMDIPMNVNNKKQERKSIDLNPQATEFNPILTDSRGVAYVMTNTNGVTYFNPKTDQQNPNPNYVIDTRSSSDQEYSEENHVNHPYGMPLSETYASDQTLQIVSVANSAAGVANLQVMQSSEQNYAAARGDLTCMPAQTSSQIVQMQPQTSAYVPAYVDHSNAALAPSQDVYAHSVVPTTPAAMPSTVLMQVPGTQVPPSPMCAGFQQVTYPPQTPVGYPTPATVVNSTQFTFSAADQEQAAASQENCTAQQFAISLPSPFPMLPQPGSAFVNPTTDTSVISPYGCFPTASPLQAGQAVTVVQAAPAQVYSAMTQPATQAQHAPPVFNLQAQYTKILAGGPEGASEAPHLIGAHEVVPVVNTQAEAGAGAVAIVDREETSSTESNTEGLQQKVREYVRHSIRTEKPLLGECEISRELRAVITKVVQRVRRTESESTVPLTEEQLVEMVYENIYGANRSASEVRGLQTVSETGPAEETEMKADGQSLAQPSPALATASAECLPSQPPTHGPLVESSLRSLGPKARDGNDKNFRLPSSSGAQEVSGSGSTRRERDSKKSGCRDLISQPPTMKSVTSLKADDLSESRRDSLGNVCVEERISYFECNKAEVASNRVR